MSPVAQISLADPGIIQSGDEFSYTLPSDAFADPEGDSLHYSVLLVSGDGSLPDFLSFNSITRTLSGKSARINAGHYEILFQANDGYGAIANSSVVRVQVNTQPVPMAVKPWQVDALPIGHELEFKLPFDFMIDADGDSISYSLVRTNPEHPVPAWVSLANGTLAGVPLVNSHQPITLQLKGVDGFGGEAYQLISIDIPNSVPRFSQSLGVITAYAGELKTFVVPSGIAIDADGDVLLFAAFKTDNTGFDRLPLPIWATHLAGINSFNFVPKSGDQGNYTFILVATDVQGASAQIRFDVHVPNRVPILNTPYADEALGPLEELSYAVFGHFVDPDGDGLSYTLSKPDWVSYDENTKVLSGFPPQFIKDYHISITADDGYGGQTQARVRMKVDPTAIQLDQAQVLQIVGYATLTSTLFIASSLFLIRRHRKIYRAEQGAQGIMRQWLASRQSIESITLDDDYQVSITTLLAGSIFQS